MRMRPRGARSRAQSTSYQASSGNSAARKRSSMRAIRRAWAVTNAGQADLVSSAGLFSASLITLASRSCDWQNIIENAIISIAIIGQDTTRLAGHNMTRIINRKELQIRLSKAPAPVLLEALPATYYLEGHLAGALHFPHERARALAPLLAPDKQNSIIVYCA